MHVAQEAAEWLTTLMSGDATAEEQRRWTAWRNASADNERAWQHIERVSAGFAGMNSAAARNSLARAGTTRRKNIKMLVWLCAIGVTGVGGIRTTTARYWLADASAPTGIRRDMMLVDGSSLTLQSGSAVNIRFTADRRLLELVKGALFVATAQEAGPYRPFIIETQEGFARALGTRYSVQENNGITMVAVEEGAVELTPRLGRERVTVHAGQSATMTAYQVDTPQRADDRVWGWMRGQILADGMRLQDFLSELSRYRPGFITCDATVADLQISGVFPTTDTDQVLASITNSLPLRIRFVARYWVIVEPLVRG